MPQHSRRTARVLAVLAAVALALWVLTWLVENF